jgi:hypothetical protein
MAAPVMARRRLGTLAAVPPLPGMAAVALLLVWAYHDGGYDAGTWYWGALVVLALVAIALISPRRPSLSAPVKLALLAFSLYVGWSYLSIAWARSAGDALQGSNRALLFLLIFALFSLLDWRSEAALWTLVVYVIGLGVIEGAVLIRLATAPDAFAMFSGARLVTPTGYYNATAALFTISALLAIALSVRRELPLLLRGLTLAIGCGGLQLAVLAQSRGWLFTLPAVAVIAALVVRERLRVAVAAAVAVVATLAVLRPLLHVFKILDTPRNPDPVFRHAGKVGLIACGAVFVVGVGLAAWDRRARVPSLSRRVQRVLGAVVAAAAIAAAIAGGVVATHGHPFRFVSRQWSGFTNVNGSGDTGSHFSQVGTSRYDFWRVSLYAVGAHPLQGLGQDNFSEYYVTRRHTSEEPTWTHSIELRLLVHTGIVGFLLFTAFIVAAVLAALRTRRTGGLAGALAGAAMLPLVVWLVHGSVDWFWEMPALSGPALAFLGLAGALAPRGAVDPAPAAARRPLPRSAVLAGTGVAVLAGTVVLGFPYLSVTRVSNANHISARSSAQALRDAATAADLNPLSAEPGRVGGTIALRTGRPLEAQQRFEQAIARDPGGWYAWFGAGLAASALGENIRAQRAFKVAASINDRQRAVTEALARVNTVRPLTPAQGLRLLTLAR